MRKIEPIITSRKNQIVVDTAALFDKKYRDRAGLFLVEGEKLVLEAAARGLPVLRIFVAEGKLDAILPRLEAGYAGEKYKSTELFVLGDECFSKISSEKSPQGVIAVLKYLDFFKSSTIIYDEDIFSLRDHRMVMLYGVQDPGNLGAIIRSAVAFGTECLILSEGCADVYNTKTIRAAMGSIFSLRIFVVSDFASAIRAMQSLGRRVFAAELREGAMPLSEAMLSKQDCVLIGNEGHGIPPEISTMCDASVFLPISSGAESLNAAVAASIFLWEQGKK